MVAEDFQIPMDLAMLVGHPRLEVKGRSEYAQARKPIMSSLVKECWFPRVMVEIWCLCL